MSDKGKKDCGLQVVVHVDRVRVGCHSLRSGIRSFRAFRPGTRRDKALWSPRLAFKSRHGISPVLAIDTIPIRRLFLLLLASCDGLGCDEVDIGTTTR